MRPRANPTVDVDDARDFNHFCLLSFSSISIYAVNLEYRPWEIKIG